MGRKSGKKEKSSARICELKVRMLSKWGYVTVTLEGV